MRNENVKFNLWQRFGALALAAVMVLGMLPTTGTADTGTGTADAVQTWHDPETLTRPQTIYGDNTLNAGKVTVGKSVSDSAITVDGKTVGLTGENNFLITMSQSAQVVGLAAQSKMPVDVVFVLDTSGSMEDNNRAETLVTAANTAIATLMAANDQNRIAVVAFSSAGGDRNGTYGGGTSGGAAANVLSSLAHYDGDAADNHLQWVNSQGGTTGNDKTYIAGRDPATIQVNNQTRNVNAFRNGKNGGTNIQAGITVGAQLLTAVTNTTYTDPETNQTVTRIPFLIVLSDGQPTFSYNDEEWYAPEASSSEQGPGSSAYEGNGFLTALTAAYYKGLITEHYYGEKANAENHCFVYTIGVEIDKLSGDELNLAQITLDPATYTTGDYAADGADSYWNYGNSANDNNQNADYGWKNYWNKFLAEPAADYRIRVNRVDQRDQNYTITAESIAAAKKYVGGVGYTGGLAYNDDHYNASNVSELEDIFKSLVATIQQKAISAPTRVSSGDHNFDGYVTFTDPLGEYMELKDMKGIIADGYFYQGVSAAQYLQSAANAEFEKLILEVLETRMGMTASTHITAEELLAAARASENQAYYKSAADYDNSIVWWGKTYHSGEEDTGMQVLGAADNDTIDYITTATNIPDGAEYVCRSYFFYGEAGGANTNPDHQYLYFVVRVQRSLSEPYQQTVVVSAPASLLSMEKVLITESYDDDNNKVYTATVVEETPLRVVYEVGLWDNITSENVSAVVSSGYAAEGPKDNKGQDNVELNDAGQEVYHFFTNDWDRNQAQGSHHRAQTKVTFDAAADNAFYTYQEDTLLVDANGNPVTSQPKAGDVVYYVREYYDWTNATKNEDGTYTATLKTELIAVTIPDDITFVVEDGQYYIPKGTYTAATLIVNGDDTEKDPNATGTSEIVAHPHRTGESNNSHYTVYLGNNGVISLVSNPPVPEKTVANVTQQIEDADGNAVMVGDVLTYTIKAENYSDKTATLIVTDTVPAGTELVAGSITDGGTVDANGKITWTLENRAPGAVEEVSFQVKVTEDSLNNAIVISAITNQATVQIGENGPSYDSNTTTNPPQGKKVTNTDGSAVEGEVQVGDILLFSIEFHNDADTASDITITDIIPAGTTFLSADHNGTLSADGKQVTWIIKDVAPGAGGVVSFLVQVNADAEETIENNASIQIGTNDPKQTNETTTSVAEGDLVLKKLLAEGDSAEGKTFTLHLTESTGTLNGTYTMVSSVSGEPTVTFVDGKATVTIAAGETLTIQDLPAGAVITVTESAKPGWTPSYSSGSVTIVANDTAPATITVTNDYNTQPVKFQLHGTKTFTGDNFPTGTFTFRAQECDANGNVKEGAIVIVATATYDGTTRTVTIDFSERTFTEPVDRYYLITEDGTTLPGVTTDSAKYLLHLVVTDNGEGQLVVTQTLQVWNGTAWVDADEVTFTNTYAAAETSTMIKGVKTLTGRYLDAGEFSFQLIDAATEKVIATATNSADSNTSGAFEFPAVTYTKEGTYTYYVREVNGGAANTTYDATIFEVVVTVEDVNGQLVATQKIYKYVADDQGNYPEKGTEVNAIGFANRYNIQDTSVTLTGTKQLTGAELSAGQFSFTVYKTDATGTTKGDVVSVGMNNANGTITFAPIGFTAADMEDSVVNNAGDFVKDFYFLVVEDIPAEDGPTFDPNMYYDPTQFVVKVTVTYDPETGSLTAGAPAMVAPAGENAVIFENIKQPADVQIVPEGTKTTANAPVGVSFSFSVINTKTGNEASVGVGAANGDIRFSTMSFSQVGEYTYWIVESNAGNTTNGITYDATRYLMKVEVERDEYRKLYATVTYYAAVDGKDGSKNEADYTVPLTGNEVPSFQNEYKAGGHINLAARKSYNGNLQDGDFAFKLVRKDNGGEIDGIVKADGTVTFATMYYSLADIPADQQSTIIYYVMSEVVPTNAAMPGVTYDTKTYDVYVKITNNGNGTISAVLVDKDGNPLTTDNAETTAYVETGITFTNVYEVTTGAEVKIEATKTLTGRDMTAGEFGFALYRYDGQEWKNIGTAFNTASGDISFIREYNADTLGHQHFTNLDSDANLEYAVLYRIDEINNNLGGVTYSGSSYYVKVIIEHDEEKATYKVESVTYYTDEACTKEATAVVFANEYSTNDAQFTPVGKKVLLGAGGKTLDPAGFTFEVIEVDANGNPLKVTTASGKESNKVVATGTSDSTGKVTFSAVHFADESQCAAENCTDDGCTGTVHSHYYMIHEPDGTATGVTYSDQTYYVKVVIHDNGKGLLEVKSVTYYSDAFQTEIDDSAVVITNHYGPGYMNLELELDKAFQVKVGDTYESYVFELLGSEFDFEVRDENGNLVTTGTNGPSDPNGVADIIFGTITVNKAGTYTYYITEVPRDGVTHILTDGTEIKVVVTVTDDGYGNLTATYRYFAGNNELTGENRKFTNTYDPAAVDVVLEINKALSGKNLNGEKFTFVLKDATGNTVATVQNGADGKAVIKLNYDAVDMSGAEKVNGVYSRTFTYTLTETEAVENSADGTYTYDESVYTVTVTVTDNGSGKLSASVAVTKDGKAVDTIVFNNSYTPKKITVDLDTSIGAQKLITDASGNVLKRDDVVFHFEVKDLEGNVVATGTADASNPDENGYIDIDFGSFTFEAAGEYRYLITETKATVDGYVLDTTIWCTHILVRYDANTGKLYVQDADVYTHLFSGDSHSDSGVQLQAETEPLFVNIYDTNDVNLTLVVNKSLTGRNLREGEFSFVLYNEDGTIAATARNKADGTVSFHLSYTLEDLNGATSKTFVYTVKEDKGNLGGVTYDEQSYTITVEVTDNGDGTLSAKVAGKTVTGTGTVNTGVEVKNTYKAKSVKVAFQAVKHMEGMPLNHTYTFLLKDAEDKTVATGQNKPDGSIVFTPELEFTEAGVYTYTMAEENGNQLGVTFDETSFTVTVTVTDDGNGQLVADVVYSTDDGVYDLPVFINIYTPSGASAVIKADKELTGRDLKEGEFFFVLKDSEGNEIETVSNAKDGSVIFTALRYEVVGTHTYTIEEVLPDGAVENEDGTYTYEGVTYDRTVYTVTVEITDPGYDGVLDHKITYSLNGTEVDAAAFTNAYKAQSVGVKPEGTKTLTGKDMTAGEFTFHLVGNGATIILTNDANGNINFPTLVFSSVGTYTYELYEVKGDNAGITYDNTKYDITITVTDDLKGQLVADVVIKVNGEEVDVIAFTNAYQAKSVGVKLEGTKTLTGKDMTAGEFTFHLVGNGTTIILTNDANGNLNFPTIVYSKVGTYTYELYEVKGDNAGITYDDTVYTVTITVTDNLQGQLEAETKITVDGEKVDAITFANTYKAEPVGVKLEGTKTLTGKDMSAGEFTFHLVGNGATIILTNDAEGNLNFPTLVYSKAGIYTYELTEAKGDNAGITYDETKYIITVTVTDDLQGQLVADVDITVDGEEVDAITFANTYKAEPVGVKLDGVKYLEGKPLNEGEFTFHLVGNGTTIILTNDANGNLNFPTLVYSKVGTHTYELYEVKGENGGITYDDTVYTVTIEVTDDYLGQLHAEVTYTVNGEPRDAAIFTNAYQAEVVGVKLEGIKTLTGKDMTAGEFTFHLVDGNDNVIILTNDADGNINFPTLVYSKTGTYTYELFEVAGTNAGITYDDTVYTVTVTVTDDYLGQLHAEVTYTVDNETKDAAIFTNTYKAESVSVKPEGTKTLTGKDMTAGAFTFHMVDKNGNVIILTNDADGNILFPTLVYTTAGTYTYELFEVAGDDDNMDYDDAVYTITVTVTDDLVGKLHAAVTYSDPVVFENVYTPDPISVTLEGTKDLTGRDQKAGEFDFEVRDAEGNLVTTGTNTASGKIDFYDIVVDAELEMILYVSEVKGNDNQIEYDDYVYRAKLVVTNVNGQLVAEVTYLDGAVVFYNEYEEPVSPDTGDDTPVFLYTGMMALSAAAMAVLLLGCKKKERRYF